MRGLNVGQRLAWVAFGALWLVSWRHALALTMAAGLTGIACGVVIEQRQRRAQKAFRQRRRAIDEALRAARPTYGSRIGPVGYGRRPGSDGMAFLVYGGRTDKPLLTSWTVRPDEFRRVEKARWS